MLRLTNVSKYYQRKKGGEIRALQSVSLGVDPGEFVAVKGPSGCGKTTLLLSAGGLLLPGGGVVEVGGRDLYSMSPDKKALLRARSIGFVFQQFYLISYLNVLENVLAPSLAGSDKDRRGNIERAGELVDNFGLGDRINHFPAELSTGERQRVSLARALFNRPRLLLADEPTGNLDSENSAVVLDTLAVFAETGGAVLMVTHSDTAAGYAHRSLMLLEGKVVE
ncbi:MAG: ABC transporter ATP-binding protein [Gemmatimonadota bacterium]|nr:ABC transporter ATP-binding protein [Gemmatimonadota bacterium]